jgi:hypothetical protein
LAALENACLPARIWASGLWGLVKISATCCDIQR